MRTFHEQQLNTIFFFIYFIVSLAFALAFCFYSLILKITNTTFNNIVNQKIKYY